MTNLKYFAKFMGMVALSIVAIAVIFRFMPAGVKSALVGWFQIA
jgi:hypothetical protein